MTIQVLIEGLDELKSRWEGQLLPRLGIAATQAVLSAVTRGADVARSLVPVSEHPKGTHLRDVIVGRVLSGEADETWLFAVTGEIVAPKPYAKFVEGGTRPHEIRPRRARALAFTGSDGATHFAGKVDHPGTAPHPFMGPAYFAAEQRLAAEMDARVDSAVTSFNDG